jgi:hypothetical protein
MTLTKGGDGRLRPASATGPGRRPVEVPSLTSLGLAADAIRWDPDVARLSAFGCPDCCNTLMLHQPDQAAPDLLLAACRECRCWLLIDIVEGVIVRFPVQEAMREARDALAAAGVSEPVDGVVPKGRPDGRGGDRTAAGPRG